MCRITRILRHWNGSAFRTCTITCRGRRTPGGVGQGQMLAGRLRFKLHSSSASYIPHTSYIYVDCHTLEAGELSFRLGSEPIGCTVGISSRRRPRYHIPPAWRRLLEKRHSKIGGPHIFVTTFLYLQSLRCMQDASG